MMGEEEEREGCGWFCVEKIRAWRYGADGAGRAELGIQSRDSQIILVSSSARFEYGKSGTP